MIVTQTSVEEVINGLLDGVSATHEVADRLKAAHCEGYIADIRDCPTAKYLTLKLTEAGYTGFSVGVAPSYCHVFRIEPRKVTLCVSFPQLLNSFINEMDAECFPDLVLG